MCFTFIKKITIVWPVRFPSFHHTHTVSATIDDRESDLRFLFLVFMTIEDKTPTQGKQKVITNTISMILRQVTESFLQWVSKNLPMTLKWMFFIHAFLWLNQFLVHFVLNKLLQGCKKSCITYKIKNLKIVFFFGNSVIFSQKNIVQNLLDFLSSVSFCGFFCKIPT